VAEAAWKEAALPASLPHTLSSHEWTFACVPIARTTCHRCARMIRTSTHVFFGSMWITRWCGKRLCTHSGTQRVSVCVGAGRNCVHLCAYKSKQAECLQPASTANARGNPGSDCDHQCFSSPRLASISFGASVSAWGEHRKQVDTACPRLPITMHVPCA
jgi:hypothetical protein